MFDEIFFALLDLEDLKIVDPTETDCLNFKDVWHVHC